MELDATQRRILALVGDRGPVAEEALAGELATPSDVLDVTSYTRELQRAALIEQPEGEGGGYVLTEDGRRALAGAGG